jgi:hypothetical protein
MSPFAKAPEPNTTKTVAAMTHFHAAINGDISLEDFAATFSLPEALVNDLHRFWATTNDAESRARVLLYAADFLVAVGQVEHGLGASMALHQFWQPHLVNSSSSYAVEQISLASTALFSGLYRAGQFHAILEHAPGFIAGLNVIRMPLAALLLRIHQARAFVQTSRPNDARILLPDDASIEVAEKEQAGRKGSVGTRQQVILLRDNLRQDLDFMQGAALAEPEEFAIKTKRMGAEITDAVRSIAARTGQGPAWLTEFEKELASRLAESPINPIQQKQQMVSVLNWLKEKLGPLVPGVGFDTDDLGRITQSPLAAYDSFERLMSKEAKVGNISGWQSYAWNCAEALTEQGHLGEALSLLEKIKQQRDEMCAMAPSPRERAEVAGAFQALPYKLALLRALTGQSAAAIFEAIEWGKARWVTGSQAPPNLDTVQKMLSVVGADYFTFSAGAGGVVAMFVPADGPPQWREIGITTSEVAAVINFMRFAPNAQSSLLSELDRRLAPLTDWLPLLGNTPLLISPYGQWHEIPLHLLPLQGGARLGQDRITSRLHGANVLARLLAASVQPPRQYLLLYAPLNREAADPRRQSAIAAMHGQLSHALPGLLLAEFEATSDAMIANSKAAQLLHLSAHGDTAPEGRYYTRSGLLLAANGQLPQRGEQHFSPPHLLTPEILCSQIPADALSRGHVTLQACVSAHAKPNLQGDAIGLEWAFFTLGASSVLSSFWHAGFDVSTRVCQEFYRLWLHEGYSRGEALLQAQRKIAAEGAGLEAFAFALAGDWR